MSEDENDKMLGLASKIILERINEMKASLTMLIAKMEMNGTNIQFPDVLDSFAVICSQVILDLGHRTYATENMDDCHSA